MNTRTGTSHFVSLGLAQRYYAPQGESAMRKIREGAIVIGEPWYNRDKDRLHVDRDGRYWISRKR